MTAVAKDRAELDAMRAGQGRVAVVMTMGALHEGHLALIERARAEARFLIVTIFVNPLQFGPNEDFDRYPRTFDADLALCEQAGVDAVFAPDVTEVYPGGEPMVKVTPGSMGEVLEGEFRPGFFTGVLTVVAKLLNLARPDAAYFGEKDAQQLALIRRMVLDLNIPVEIVGVPTVREPDGLALSSRNRYLCADERPTALALSQALRAGAAERTPDAIRAAARKVLDDAEDLDVDYLALVDPSDFAEAGPGHTGPAVLAVAARVGKTRLIDNVPLVITPSPGA